MHAVTKQKSRRVRRALLAQSDAQLRRIVEAWLASALQAWPMNGSDDEALFALGYQLQETETGRLYTSWDDLEADEHVEVGEIALVQTTAVNWREQIAGLALPTFYHVIIWAAGEALANTAFADVWGPPPGEKRSGYAFLDKLADHLVLAHELSENDLDRFAYAAQRLGILPYRDEDPDEWLDEVVPDLPTLYPEIDAEIERLVHEPELPYWMRARQQRHKQKRKRK